MNGHPKDCTCNECYLKWQKGKTDAAAARRRTGDERKEQILQAAVEIARVNRYIQMSGVEIAKAANFSHGLIALYFGSMGELRKEVMHRAIRDTIPEIIFQGLAVGCEIARSAPERLKAKAVEPFSG